MLDFEEKAPAGRPNWLTTISEAEMGSSFFELRPHTNHDEKRYNSEDQHTPLPTPGTSPQTRGQSSICLWCRKGCWSCTHLLQDTCIERGCFYQEYHFQRTIHTLTIKKKLYRRLKFAYCYYHLKLGSLPPYLLRINMWLNILYAHVQLSWIASLRWLKIK